MFRKPGPIEWLCLPVGLFLTIHYSWLLDDAFVYYRYVDNLLYLGYGLVYNANEYVEGYSSPLWMIVLILLRATGVNYWIITRALGAVAFALCWMLLIALNRQLSPRRSGILNFPLCYLAFNYGALSYFTSGMETPLVQVAAVLYALFVLNPTARWLQLLLAVTPILRPELTVPFVICLAWAWMRGRTFPLGMAVAGALVSGAWEAFRIYYYADLFPNTFYLKNTTDVAQGLIYLHDTAGTYQLYALIAVFLLLGLLCRFKEPIRPPTKVEDHPARQARPKPDARRRRTGRRKTDAAGRPENQQTKSAQRVGTGTSLRIPERLMMVLLALSVAAYIVKIGGDARHYRFLAFPFCLCVCAAAGIAEQSLARFTRRRLHLAMTLVGLVVALGAFACYPPQLDAHPFFGKQKHTIVNKISDASGHRHNKLYPHPPWGSGAEIELKDQYKEFLRTNPDRSYRGVNQTDRCQFIYQCFDERFVHTLGLTEPVLARTEMKADRPAHKFGLLPLAEDIFTIMRSPGIVLGRGMYRRAVETGTAPRWVADNLESIEVIERKMFNGHNFAENLRLAFTFPEKIKPPAQR